MKNFFFLISLSLLFSYASPLEASFPFTNQAPWKPKYQKKQVERKKIGSSANAILSYVANHVWLSNGHYFSLGPEGKKRSQKWKSGDPLSLQYKGKRIYSFYNLRTKDIVYALWKGQPKR